MGGEAQARGGSRHGADAAVTAVEERALRRLRGADSRGWRESQARGVGTPAGRGRSGAPEKLGEPPTVSSSPGPRSLPADEEPCPGQRGPEPGLRHSWLRRAARSTCGWDGGQVAGRAPRNPEPQTGLESRELLVRGALVAEAPERRGGGTGRGCRLGAAGVTQASTPEAAGPGYAWLREGSTGPGGDEAQATRSRCERGVGRSGRSCSRYCDDVRGTQLTILTRATQ